MENNLPPENSTYKMKPINSADLVIEDDLELNIPPTMPTGSKAYCEIFRVYSSLGLIIFGGPAAHFSFFNHLFVENLKWISTSTFTQMYAVTNALPGPASTQTAFAIALMRSGLISALLSFILWSAPGAIIFLGLAILVTFIPPNVPEIVVFLRSGFSAVALGLICGAGYKLSQSMTKDGKYDGLLVFICFVGVAISILFSDAAWMPPVVIIIGGLIRYGMFLYNRRKGGTESDIHISTTEAVEPEERLNLFSESILLTVISFSAWLTLLILSLLASRLPSTPVGNIFKLLAAFYLGGAIIFGDGPLVVPLLYNYVVAPGWITPEQFLFGLAIMNILPGPPLNFAAYAGALGLVHLSGATTVSAKIGAVFLGGILSNLCIFFPALLLQFSVIPIWNRFRKAKKMLIFFEGVCAAAIGLIFGSVFSLWLTLRDSDAQQSKTLSPAFEAVLAVISYGTTTFDVFPLWSIFFATCLSLIYYAIYK